MNANADALSRNPVEIKQSNVITRRQAAMQKDTREKISEVGKTKKKVLIPVKNARQRTKRKRKEEINYAKSSIESDCEAEARLPEREAAFKNYQNSPTNDEPAKIELKSMNLNYDGRNSDTDLFDTDDESCETETVVKIDTDKSTCDQQLINGNLDNDESTSQIKATSETAFNNNIVETKELLQCRSDNIAYFVASNGNPV